MISNNIYIDDGKGIIHSEASICLEMTKVIYGGSDKIIKNLKSLRQTSENNHALEEARLSVRIAKTNVNIDPSNKYYLDQLKKAEKNLENVKICH